MKQTPRIDTAISDLQVHAARMRTPERLKVATVMSRMQSSIRKVKKNQLVEAVEKLPDLLPVSHVERSSSAALTRNCGFL